MSVREFGASKPLRLRWPHVLANWTEPSSKSLSENRLGEGDSPIFLTGPTTAAVVPENWDSPRRFSDRLL
jgi:hypothetical protein